MPFSTSFSQVKQPRAHAQCKRFNGATLPPNTSAAGKPVPPKKPTPTKILSPTAERLVANGNCRLCLRRFAEGAPALRRKHLYGVFDGQRPAKPLLDAVNDYGCFLIRSSGADVVPCVEAPKPSSGVLAAGAPGRQRDPHFSASQQTCLKRSRCII